MENFDLDKIKDEGASRAVKHNENEEAVNKLKRDHDSLDDFEHLDHDSSPVNSPKEMASQEDSPRAVGVPKRDSIDKGDEKRTAGFQSQGNLPAADDHGEQKPRDTSSPPPFAEFSNSPAPLDRVEQDLGVLDKVVNNVSDILDELNFAQAQFPAHADPKSASVAFMDGERSGETYAPRIPSDYHQAELSFGGQKTQGGILLPEKVPSSISPTATEELQRALEAQVAEARAEITKSESVEDVFEDLAKAALKMPEIQDAINPKDDLFGFSDSKGEGERVEDRNIFEEEHDAYGQVKKPELGEATRENSAKIFGTLDFEVDQGAAKGPGHEVEDFLGEIRSAVLPEPQKSPEVDFLREEGTPENKELGKQAQQQTALVDDSWNVVEKPADKFEKCEPLEKLGEIEEPIPEAPTKSLPPIPRDATPEPPEVTLLPKATRAEEFSDRFIKTETAAGQKKTSPIVTGASEFESEAEFACRLVRPAQPEPTTKTEAVKKPERSGGLCFRKDPVEEIAPKEIFREMGLDAWFNPERLNPKVEALIYWRDPKKSGIVFGAILGVLLSLAYFSLISVLAYLSLIILTGTVAFRIYKTVLQAVQKTADGHPFKDVLDVDLTLPAEKVHDVADVAVAHANAAVAELRRLFLVEDLVDSLKFGVLLWCLTYLGAWFNGMTLIIIGVVALFSLPKVYETNKTQIDQNLDIVRAKVNELTAKVKAAIPLGKKTEPTKEE